MNSSDRKLPGRRIFVTSPERCKRQAHEECGYCWQHCPVRNQGGHKEEVT